MLLFIEVCASLLVDDDDDKGGEDFFENRGRE